VHIRRDSVLDATYTKLGAEMASIQRIISPLTNEVFYRAQVRVKGHETQSGTFPNKKEAQAWSSGVEAAIREGRNFPGTGSVLSPAIPLDFSIGRLPAQPALRLGEHTEEILTEILGISATEFGQLHDQGIVATAMA
jgi:hypothetical protein